MTSARLARCIGSWKPIHLRSEISHLEQHSAISPLAATPKPSDSGLACRCTAQARRTARRRPRLGSFIAAVTIPGEGSIRWERTLGADGHHTVWGDPADLLACVTSIEPL